MMRVAQVMGQMNGGGVEAVVMNYYRCIDKSRVQFDFIVERDSTMVPRDEIESLGGRVFIIPSIKNLKRYRSELRACFEANRWIVVHSHRNTLSVFPLGVAKKAGIPVRIAHSHSTSNRLEIKRALAKSTLRFFSNVYPTHRMACTKQAGQWLFGSKPFDVVPNAIDCERFKYDLGARIRYRKEWNIPDNAFVLGHVGRWATPKNQVALLPILSECRKRGINAKLALIGDGPDEEEINKQIHRLGLEKHVILPGYISSGCVYSAFDAFVFPSLYEGFGMAALEAQVAGLPCVVSEGVPKEVDITGAVRFLPVDAPELWVDKLLEVSLLQRMPADIQLFADYDVKLVAERLVDRYERMREEAE